MADETWSSSCSGTRVSPCKDGSYTGHRSLKTQPTLCEDCQRKQKLKIQELHTFEPAEEAFLEEEFKKYADVLESKYCLCRPCQSILEQHLESQDKYLKTGLLESKLHQTKQSQVKMINRLCGDASVYLVLVQLLSLTFISFLLYTDLQTKLPLCDLSVSWLSWQNMTQISQQWSKQTWQSLSNIQSPTDIWKEKYSYIRAGKSAACSVTSRLSTYLTCLCGLVKENHMSVTILCLILQLLVFMKRKTRVGLVNLMSWTLLLLLCTWELYVQKTARWKLILVLACFLLGLCTTFHQIMLYITWNGKRKTKRYQFRPNSSSSPKNTLSVNCNGLDKAIQGMDTSTETEVVEESGTEFDCNLNAMTLGSATLRKSNGDLSNQSGSFWNSSSNMSPQNSSCAANSPLVAMRERPLIVPATLQYHSSPRNPVISDSVTSHRKWQESVHKYPSSESEDEVRLLSTSTKECRSRHQRRRSKNSPKSVLLGRIPPTAPPIRSRFSYVKSVVKTLLLLIGSFVKTLLLLSSFTLNCYLIAKHTDWLPRYWALLKGLKR